MQHTLSFRSLSAFAPDAGDAGFATLCQSPVTHATGFRIGSSDLRVTFDANKGGRVRLAGIVPPAGAPHYRLTPIDLGSADWCAIEMDIPAQDLAGLASLVPCMDAASPRKLSLFAVLRVTGADGRSHDGSSTMVELGPERRRAVFPVSLSDIPALALTEAVSARVIFFLEARQVDLDLYGLSMTGIPLAKPVIVTDALRALRILHTAGRGKPTTRILSPSSRKGWKSKVEDHAEIAKDVFVDIEPGPGRAVAIRKTWSRLDLDFETAAPSAWRTLEFRFPPFVDSGRMAVALRVSAEIRGTMPAAVSVCLRRYPGKGLPFRDAFLGAGLMLHPDAALREFRFDLSPVLTDQADSHEVGLMLFLPATIGTLSIQEIEATLHDLSGT